MSYILHSALGHTHTIIQFLAILGHMLEAISHRATNTKIGRSYKTVRTYHNPDRSYPNTASLVNSFVWHTDALLWSFKYNGAFMIWN